MLSAAPNPLFFSLCPRLREEIHWAASPAPGRASCRSENSVGKKLCLIYFNWTEASGEWGCKRTCCKCICLSSHFISLRHGKLSGETVSIMTARELFFKNTFSLMKFQYDHFYWNSCLFTQWIFTEYLLSAWHYCRFWGYVGEYWGSKERDNKHVDKQ